MFIFVNEQRMEMKFILSILINSQLSYQNMSFKMKTMSSAWLIVCCYVELFQIKPLTSVE